MRFGRQSKRPTLALSMSGLSNERRKLAGSMSYPSVNLDQCLPKDGYAFTETDNTERDAVYYKEHEMTEAEKRATCFICTISDRLRACGDCNFFSPLDRDPRTAAEINLDEWQAEYHEDTRSLVL